MSEISSSGHPILEAWAAVLARSSGEPAIFQPDGRVARSFQAIEEEAGTYARELLATVEQGAVVAVQIGNSPAWPALLLALFRRQLIPLPLGGHMRPAEQAQALAAAGARWIVTRTAETLQAAPVAGATAVSVDADFLKLTSGTTSAARAVRFRAHQLLADCRNICATMGIGAGDLNFGVIPFSHSYGFSNLLLPLLCLGVPLVASEDPLPRAILHGLRATGATVFPGVPVHFAKLAALPEAAPLPALRLCISAGAPLPAETGVAFSARFGRKVHTFYGSSECGGIAYDRAEDFTYEEGHVGTAMDGVEISGGGDSEPARITIASAAVAEGYFPAEERETLGEGRFSPADLIRRRGDGIFIAGRASDVINVAGRKVSPAEIEQRIAAFPGVSQVVVFGAPSVTRGEEPIACIAGSRLDLPALRRFCLQHLSAWQMPRDFWLVAEIPANERGKISRRQLAEAFAQKTMAGRPLETAPKTP